MSISEEIGDIHGVATILNNLGTLERIESNYEQAEEIYKKALKIFKEIGDKNGMVKLLCNLGIKSENDELISKDEILSKLKKVFTDEEYKTYWDEGKRTNIEIAVELALGKER